MTEDLHVSERPTASRYLAVLGLFGLLAATACSSPVPPTTDTDGGQGGQTTTAPATQGGGDGGGRASGDLCGLVSEDQIAEFSGNDVTATEPSEGGCTWTIGETDAINLRYESAFDPGLEIARQVCDDAEDVEGVGDEAVWCPGFNVLYFNTGPDSLAVQLIYILEEPGRAQRDIAIDIANAALGGL